MATAVIFNARVVNNFIKIAAFFLRAVTRHSHTVKLTFPSPGSTLTVPRPRPSTRRMKDSSLTPVLTEEAPGRVPPCLRCLRPPARGRWTPAGPRVSRTETVPTSDSAASMAVPTLVIKVSPEDPAVMMMKMSNSYKILNVWFPHREKHCSSNE